MLLSSETYSFPLLHRLIEVKLGFGHYLDNGSIAILLMCREADIDEDLLEDEDYEYDESLFEETLGALTVNLEASRDLCFGEQFVDINMFPHVGRWLEENNLAYPTGRKELSGNVIYPVYKFTTHYISLLTP